MENKVNENIYKYCDKETFKKIIEHHSLRMNDVLAYNDKKELIFVKNLIYKSLNKLKKKVADEKVDTFTNNCNIVMNDWFEDSGYKYFALCFSKDKDSELMFKQYGDNKGVAIGFEKEDFIFEDNKFIMFDKIEYINEESEEIDEFVLDIYHKYKKMEGNCNLAPLFDNFGKIAFTVAGFRKNIWWKNENECRFGFWFEYKYNDKYKNVLLKNENFEIILPQNVDLLKSDNFYMELKFLNNNLIKEIILGPNSYMSEEFVKSLLLQNGYGDDIKVFTSNGKIK